jgi:hypothetical protein
MSDKYDRYTKQKIKKSQIFIFVYNMIKNGVFISEKFVCLKPTSKSISTLLKLELIKLNLSSVKI